MLGFLMLVNSSCAPPREPGDLIVAAAASLAPAFERIRQSYIEIHGQPVTMVYSSSGNLAAQIRNGAPYDLFASADQVRVDQLIKEGYLEADSRIVFAQGVLVLAQSPSSSRTFERLEQLVGVPDLRVAIANPRHAPYGTAAQQALEYVGMWEGLESRLVYGESVRQTAQFAETGNVEVALISASTAISANMLWHVIPSEYYNPILHTSAVHRDTDNREMAIAFLDFLSSPAAQEILQQSGFSTDGSP